eukprot:COSAG01_NODE_3259_length_6338_cov_3.955281_5_plen_43_part_00
MSTLDPSWTPATGGGEGGREKASRRCSTYLLVVRALHGVHGS